MSFNSAASTFTAFVLGALLLVSCGGGGSGGGGAGAGPATTDMLITDATVDELLAFKTTIFSLRLVSTTGIAGNNLLSAPLTIDLIGAGAAPRWVAREDLPEGTFRGVAVSITPLSTTAIDRGGAAVAVTEVATAFELPTTSAVTALWRSQRPRARCCPNPRRCLPSPILAPFVRCRVTTSWARPRQA